MQGLIPNHGRRMEPTRCSGASLVPGVLPSVALGPAVSECQRFSHQGGLYHVSRDTQGRRSSGMSRSRIAMRVLREACHRNPLPAFRVRAVGGLSRLSPRGLYRSSRGQSQVLHSPLAPEHAQRFHQAAAPVDRADS
jgi:hypothetical protein